RGHRRTYVGALPGRIIQSMKTVGVKNPVFLLDEIDKLSAEYRGDPAAALLEVLDPEQNNTFTDHYLEIPYDLSEVFFICTGNVKYQIPRALADRMDIIDLPGYMFEEKVNIGLRHLLPKVLNEHGLTAEQVKIPQSVMQHIVTDYTREAGVRNLERQLATICRKAARRIHLPENALANDGPSAGITITLALISAITGRPIRENIAMTAEITLHGRILGVGRLKEKVLAAHQANINHLIVPAENKKDMADIPVKIQRRIRFTFVETMDQVIDIALLGASHSEAESENQKGEVLA